MAYVRHDINNTQVSTQPVSNQITLYSGTEGWSEITYNVWNGDYIARKSDNTSRTPGTYQARNSNNTVRNPGSYQRYDINNNQILN